MVELIIIFLISLSVTILWVRGIDSVIKHKKENPDWDEKQGWLDWDKKQENEKTN